LGTFDSHMSRIHSGGFLRDKRLSVQLAEALLLGPAARASTGCMRGRTPCRPRWPAATESSRSWWGHSPAGRGVRRRWCVWRDALVTHSPTGTGHEVDRRCVSDETPGSTHPALFDHLTMCGFSCVVCHLLLGWAIHGMCAPTPLKQSVRTLVK